MWCAYTIQKMFFSSLVVTFKKHYYKTVTNWHKNQPNFIICPLSGQNKYDNPNLSAVLAILCNTHKMCVCTHMSTCAQS